ncbi:CYFA0S09e02234g1_1 [Cyberlindnera fabianii]|uniref:CYFA0S09e02234g1_1 n=1 Tax=Cyberlindnera fabianii TaxID=36022 RepID=A0A061B3X5_CYBFA|nr:Translocation protein SEC72 [Cyberlindnera fabianii]CDR42374.1 CYFA0S09e02234g1_1 [Cyberlindnera fabianii]
MATTEQDFALSYDPATKVVSAVDTTDKELVEDLEALNRLVKDLVACPTEVPESPQPSTTLQPMIQKLANSGITALKQRNFSVAAKQLTLAIDMASRRARWEAFAVQVQEMVNLLQARCDAYVMGGQFMDAYNDADILLQLQANTPENFLRKALPLVNMGRLDEAKIELERALAFHPDQEKLKQHYMMVKTLIGQENGDVEIQPAASKE